MREDPIFYFTISAEDDIIVSEICQIQNNIEYQKEFEGMVKKLNMSETLIHYIIVNKVIYIVSEDENYIHIFRSGILFSYEHTGKIL